MAHDSAFISWSDDNGPHIHFYDESISFEEYGEMLVSLGLAVAVEDDA